MARNTVWNLLGAVIPIGASLIAIPALVSQLGLVSFGILGVVWAISAFFGILDFGIGRALTRYVADLLARGRSQETRRATRTAVLVLFALGTGSGLVLILSSEWMASQLLDLPAALEDEARLGFVLVGISAPAALVSSAFVGLLESHQRFDLVNAVRLPYSTATFIIPAVLVTWFSGDLTAVVLSIVLLRIITMIPYAYLASRVYQPHQTPGFFSRSAAKALSRFGGWLTISNLASPFLMSSDRFVIGATVSVAAVGIYTAPYEAAIRLLVIPVAISGVTFAAVSASLPSGGRKPGEILSGSLYAVCAVVLPLVVILSAFAPELLEQWLGPTLARDGATVFQILALGVFTNSLASPLFASILAGNRPDWVAKLHVAEVPIYLAALVVFVPKGGIVAAAMIWMIRVTADAGVVAFLSNRVVQIARIDVHRILGFAAVAVILLVALPFIDSVLPRAIGCCVALGAAALSLHWAVGSGGIAGKRQ